MKKILFAFALLSCIQVYQPVKAQDTIPNAGFETWTADELVPTAYDPNRGNGSTGWWDFNFDNSTLVGSSPVTVFKDSVNPSPYSGHYCAKIISAPMTTTTYSTINSYGFDYPDTNGIIVTGNLDVGLAVSLKTGIPFDYEMKQFSFYYRYVPNGTDTCSCTIVMYNWNSVKHERDTIGFGYWDTSATITGWRRATVNINYNPDSMTVDTAFILFSACSLHSKPKANDTMNIDATTVGVTGIENITADHDNVTLYPNPSNDEINFAVTGQFQPMVVEVYDITGKAVGTYSIHNNFLTINTQSYSNGMYFYKLLDNSGVQLNVGKFSVVK